MEASIETAIKLLAKKIDDTVSGNDALKFTQAALNLAQTESTIEHTKLLKLQKP